MFRDLFSERDTKSTAIVSVCDRYRYQLTRQWDIDKPTILFIMLNPSTADAFLDDPTIRRCVGFAKEWGYGSLSVVNLFAWKDRHPDGLLTSGDPVGRDNIDYLFRSVREAELIVCAWGNSPILKKLNINKQFNAITSINKPLHCLGLSVDGTPKHPLYLPKSTKPVQYFTNKH